MPGLPLIRLAEVDSTQAFLRRHPHLHPVAVMADRQSEGRGRQGHRWESGAGQGLWLSASLPPPDLSPGLVLQRAMMAVIQALGQPEGVLGLKWPNDLVARREGRLFKLGGILGERVGSRLILGVGVNLTAKPTLPERAFPPACLSDLTPEGPIPAKLAKAILEHWQDLESVPQIGFRWPAEGDPLRWEGGQGVCLGWEPDGRLRVTTAAGIERLSAGDVRGLS